MNNKRNFSSESRPFGLTFERRWVTEGIDAAGVTYCDKLGHYLCDNNMSKTQMRNIFNEIKRIELKGYANEQVNFQLLRPKVAYAVARAIQQERAQESIKEFLTMFESAHSAVCDEKTFKNLVNLCEAITAYFTVYGRK